MSLFHPSHETEPASLTDKEAVLALLFLMVTADGVIVPTEEELVIAASNRMKLLREQSIADFNASVARVRGAIEHSGREAVFKAAVAAVPAELNQALYALAGDIAFADGKGQPAELGFLRDLQEALHISDDLATKVLEVMKIKNGS